MTSHLLRVSVISHGHSTLRHGAPVKLSGQKEANISMNLVRGDGVPLVVVGQLAPKKLKEHKSWIK